MMNNKKNKAFFVIVPILCILIVGLFFYDRYQTSQLAKKFQQDSQPVTTDKEPDQPKETLPAIYCVGDSLTVGTNGNTSYPEYLKNSVDTSINTIGDANVNSAALTIILGVNPVYLNNVTIPEDTSKVKISLLNQNGQGQDALVNSKTGLAKCTINDIEGTISYNATNNQLEFARLKAGKSSKITTLTEVKVTKPEITPNSILVLFTGSYEESVQGSLAQYQSQIISAFNTDKYIVVSLTQNDRDATNNLLKTTHGDHYLDFKSYLLTDGLKDAKITATSQDQSAITNKNTPPSLLVDQINGNSKYNELLAKQLINKMNALGYLSN